MSADHAPQAHILVVDDEAAHMTALCHTLEDAGYRAAGFTSPAKALSALRDLDIDLVLTDLQMPEMDGIAFLQAAQVIDADLVVVVMTGHATIDSAVHAMQAGAFDYLQKPFRLSVLLPVVARALKVRQLRTENIQLRHAFAIHTITTMLTREFDLAAVASEVCSTGARLHPNYGVTLMTLSDSAPALSVIAASGAAVQPLLRMRVEMTDQLRSWIDRTTLLMQRSEGWQASDLVMPEGIFGASVAMPLVMGGAFVGILSLHPSEGSRPITLGQLKTFRVFATAAASVIKVSSLLDALQTSNVELEERVAGRTAQLERANQDLEAFSYSVSHDLRAPLRAIDGFTRLVLEDFSASLPETGKRSLESVCRSTQRMNELIDALLQLSQITRKPLASERVDMRTLALEVIEEIAGEHKARDIEVVVGALPPCNGDRALLHQVFFNLLANAFKFTRQRAHAKIEVDGVSAEREVTYCVRDNGSGFDSRQASRLFDPFQRLHSASEFEGSGIGLSIVQRVVTRHGGRVWAEAKVDQGATFCFSLRTSPLAGEGESG